MHRPLTTLPQNCWRYLEQRTLEAEKLGKKQKDVKDTEMVTSKARWDIG